MRPLMKSTRSLRDAVNAAQKARKRFHAIRVTPALEDAHPIATVTVSKEHETRTVNEKLE
jgi:hypothetical protein